MSVPLVYTVMVNWNRCQDALECLASLEKLDYPNHRILYVDNGSTDDSIQAITQQFPHIEQLHLSPNRGFAGGFNAGIRHALALGAELVFIISNDTTIAPQSLSALVQQLEPGVGVLAPLIYYTGSPEVIWVSGGKTNPWTLETKDHLKDRKAPARLPAFIEQDFVSGCAMLFTPAALETAGMFDEDFHFYYEDADLCLRMRRAGQRIRMVPAAQVWHKVAATSGGQDSPTERYWMARSSLRFFRKHARPHQVPIIAVWRTFSALRTSLRLLRRGRRASLQAYWKGLWDGLGDR